MPTVADAVVRVFIDNGDRTDRKKARLKYVLDAWGLENFLAEVEKQLGRPLTRLPPTRAQPNRQRPLGTRRRPRAEAAGAVYVGVVLPVGRA